jgi:hypothetical protein
LAASELGSGKQRLQELDGHDLLPLELDGLDAGHAHVLEHAQVRDVLVPEGHPEADALEPLDVLAERLELLVVEQVRLAGPHAGEVEHHGLAHGLDLHPLALLPVLPLLRDLPDVDLRVEVGGERVAVVAAVAVEDVHRVDLVEQVLLGVGAVDVGHARVEARAQQRHEARLLEALLVGPLPAVLELGLVGRLVVGGVEIRHAGLEARVHEHQVLVGQRHVDEQRGLLGLQERHGGGHVHGVQRGHADVAAVQLFDLGLDLLAARHRAAGQQDVGEDLRVHRALVRHHATHTTRTDDQDLAHSAFSVLW